jgi:hypothetical protein
MQRRAVRVALHEKAPEIGITVRVYHSRAAAKGQFLRYFILDSFPCVCSFEHKNWLSAFGPHIVFTRPFHRRTVRKASKKHVSGNWRFLMDAL